MRVAGNPCVVLPLPAEMPPLPRRRMPRVNGQSSRWQAAAKRTSGAGVLPSWNKPGAAQGIASSRRRWRYWRGVMPFQRLKAWMKLDTSP